MKTRTRSRYPFYFVLGALCLYLVFSIIPGITGIFYSFTRLERLQHADTFYRVGKFQDHFLGKRKLFTFYKKHVHIYD